MERRREQKKKGWSPKSKKGYNGDKVGRKLERKKRMAYQQDDYYGDYEEEYRYYLDR